MREGGREGVIALGMKKLLFENHGRVGINILLYFFHFYRDGDRDRAEIEIDGRQGLLLCCSVPSSSTCLFDHEEGVWWWGAGVLVC